MAAIIKVPITFSIRSENLGNPKKFFENQDIVSEVLGLRTWEILRNSRKIKTLFQRYLVWELSKSSEIPGKSRQTFFFRCTKIISFYWINTSQLVFCIYKALKISMGESWNHISMVFLSCISTCLNAPIHIPQLLNGSEDNNGRIFNLLDWLTRSNTIT